MNGSLYRRVCRVLGMVILLASGGRSVQAASSIPPELEGVTVEEHRGATIPLDLTFTDEQGHPVMLRQFFDSQRPVILNLVYYSCPMLCTLVLNGFVDGLKGVAWNPGEEFEVVTVSIDPRDSTSVASAKKANYLKAYGRPSAKQGWHFLTGTETQIKALAQSLGFSFRWDPIQKQYAHPAVIFVLTPEGKISRYLYGMQFLPRDLRLALLEASEGRIGSAVEQFLLFCYHYDPIQKKYALYATNLMRLSGALTVLVLSIVLGRFWGRERRMSAREPVSI